MVSAHPIEKVTRPPVRRRDSYGKDVDRARAATRFIREGRRPCPCGDRQPEPSPSLVASPLEDLKLGAKVRQQCGIRKRKDRKRYDRGDA
jgi:hypothetical protein